MFFKMKPKLYVMDHIMINEVLMLKIIFTQISMIGGWGISCKIALKWMSLDLTDDKSALACQPHRMGHGEYPNLKMDMDGWFW